MKEIQLTGCVITDKQNRVLLLHRRDHNQWQLPGGRIESGEVPAQAAIREVHEELDIAVTALHKLGETMFSQRDISYFCEWFQVTQYEWVPTIGEPEVYDKIRYYNLLTRRMAQMSLSQNVANLAEALREGQVQLAPNTVQ